MTYSAIAKRLAPDALREFILRELDHAGLGHNTFTPPAIDLVVRSADGVLRKARNLGVAASSKPFARPNAPSTSTSSTASSCNPTGRKTPTSPITDRATVTYQCHCLRTPMISAELLRRIRNDLPMAAAIAALGRDGPPSKLRDGRFVFLCPRCGELLAAVNPRNNLAHCFACHRNLNNIDLLRALGHDFLSAVALLERWLNQYQAQQPK